MPAPTNQLAEEFATIKEKFSNSPYITIVSTEGDPPNKYEIEFHVKGLHKDAEGNAHIENHHRVEIVLPFGFPHFPPSCKPLSPILHPDFDPDAICIAGFWNSSRTVADLIIHLGGLITFQSYSSEEVFNQEALDWAISNSDKLPLDTIDFKRQKTKKQKPEPIIEKQAAPKIAPAPAQPQKKKSKKPILIGMALVVIISCLIGALLAFDLRNFDAASKQWPKVAGLVEQNKFNDADAKIQKINKLLSNVRLLKKNEKQALTLEIRNLTSTEKYRNGVQGKLLVNGKYLTKGEVQNIQSINELIESGKKHAETEKWHEAAQSYQQAFEKADKLADLSPVSSDELKKQMSRMALEGLLVDAEEYRAQRKWDDALVSYSRALESIKDIGEDNVVSQKAAILALRDETSFLSSIHKGDEFFSDKKWSEALTQYSKTIEKSANLPAEEFQLLIRNIKQKQRIAQFYILYEAGMQNYAGAQWDTAVTNLSKSVELLDAIRQTEEVSKISTKDIERKIVTAKINSKKERIEKLIADELYVQAATILQEITRIIDKSPFKAEKEVSIIRKEVVERTTKILFHNDIQQKTTYLTKNFEKIFKDKFSSSAKSTLSEPKIEFDRKTGDFLVFKMQCTEHNRQERFNLILEYQYNTTTNMWSYR